MNISKNQTISVFSPYPVTECYTRIKNSLPKNPRYSLMPPETLIFGEVSQERCKLFKKIPAMNIFQTGLRATFKTQGGGTLVHGKMGLLPFVKYAFSFCFSLFFSIPVYFLFSPYFEAKPAIVSGALITAITLFLFIAIGEVFERLSWYCSHGESDFLKKFLTDVLDAEEK